MEDISILQGLANKIESGTCTPLEIFNIKMYVAIKGLGRERAREIMQQMIQDQAEADNESDIKITRWQDGTHFYSKYKGIDIQDDDGNVKWNTHAEAMTATLKYIKNINID